ncbi:MAG TPA: hypothetical protein VMT60_01020, partial [Candidatus Bathyarchaeia archaeon]|nr:hypothetical protein [Candidatus Bathyarchaeia archaeon]
LYEGCERDAFQGISLTLPGEGGMALDGELLFGRSFLSATGRLVSGEDGGDYFREAALERELEHGHRFLLGVSRRGALLSGGLAFAQTTLEGDPAAREGRSDGARTSLIGRLALGDSSRSVRLLGRVEQYGALNTGSTFWLGRNNFWLDGDEVSYGLIPFLSVGALYELTVSCELDEAAPRALPWGKGLRFAMTQRGSVTGGGPLFREVRLAGGVAVQTRVSFLIDMRGVSYRYGETERDFVDAFLCLRGSVAKSLWCAVGTGVNPYGFDKWLYTFSGHGREDYLYERGVFRTLAASGEAASMKTLIDAEEALAEDWVVTVEAGFTF